MTLDSSGSPFESEAPGKFDESGDFIESLRNEGRLAPLRYEAFASLAGRGGCLIDRLSTAQTACFKWRLTLDEAESLDTALASERSCSEFLFGDGVDLALPAHLCNAVIWEVLIHYRLGVDALEQWRSSSDDSTAAVLQEAVESAGQDWQFVADWPLPIFEALARSDTDDLTEERQRWYRRYVLGVKGAGGRPQKDYAPFLATASKTAKELEEMLGKAPDDVELAVYLNASRSTLYRARKREREVS